MKSRPIDRLAVAVAVIVCWGWGSGAEAQTMLKSICRVKGQEETTLQGLGIVTGLNGTGDGASALPTLRSLATMMELMGTPIAPGGTSELKDAKNVALVIVTATIPAAGARRGDKLDCAVSAISAKSLAGGRLFPTPLTGPVPQENPVVFALAQGPVTLENDEQATTARIHEGCRLVEDFFNPFSEDGRITLVVDKDYADFQTTYDIAELINTEMGGQSIAPQAGPLDPGNADGGNARRYADSTDAGPLARAVDQVNIEVTVPPYYREHLVEFVSEILGLDLVESQTGPRVVIRERSGVIVIDGDVEIGAALVSTGNIAVETGDAAAGNQFVPIDSREPDNPKLKALLAALNAVRVPVEDKIEIIKALHRDRKLYARLIIE
ncbi:MAG: flagellar basal body P-ring protein FlgI [Planctomycetota bacterium]